MFIREPLGSPTNQLRVLSGASTFLQFWFSTANQTIDWTEIKKRQRLRVASQMFTPPNSIYKGWKHASIWGQIGRETPPTPIVASTIAIPPSGNRQASAQSGAMQVTTRCPIPQKRAEDSEARVPRIPSVTSRVLLCSHWTSTAGFPVARQGMRALEPCRNSWYVAVWPNVMGSVVGG